MYKSTSSAKYFNQFQNGEEEGLGFFIKEFGEALRYFAMKITRDREVAEEIVSESFLKLWNRREKVVSVESVKSFLYLVTRNACYDFVGSAYKKQISITDEENMLTNKELKNTDILTQIIYMEMVEQIVAELCKLPRQQAEVFRMSYLEGKDTREICKALNTSTANVYFARSKALASLRSIFKEKEVGLYLPFLLFIFLK